MYETDYEVAKGLIDNYISSINPLIRKRHYGSNDENIYCRCALFEIEERIMNEMYSLPDHISNRHKPSVYDIIDNFVLEMDAFISIKYNYGFDVGRAAAKSLKRYLKQKNLF